MAIQRSTVSEIVTEIRRNIGEPDAEFSNVTDANLYIIMSRYVQRLQVHLARMVRAEGQSLQQGTIFFDWWKTEWASTTTNGENSLVVTAGSSTIYLPSNFDHWESFYDTDHDRPIEVVDEVAKWQERARMLKEIGTGPPEAVEILGYTTNSSGGSDIWAREATLYPTPESGYEPSITLTGWRMPEAVSDGADYLDVHPKYEDLVVYGVTANLIRKDDPNLVRFIEAERDFLQDLANSAKTL